MTLNGRSHIVCIARTSGGGRVAQLEMRAAPRLARHFLHSNAALAPQCGAYAISMRSGEVRLAVNGPAAAPCPRLLLPQDHCRELPSGFGGVFITVSDPRPHAVPPLLRPISVRLPFRAQPELD